MNLEFSRQIFEKFVKIRQVGEELFHADRRTEVKKLIVAFRNFTNAPKEDPLFNTHRKSSHSCPR